MADVPEKQKATSISGQPVGAGGSVPQAAQSGTAGPVQAESSDMQDDDVGYTFFEMLSTLPEAVQAYLLSPDISKNRVAIYDRLKLSPEDRSTALFTELEVFFGDVDLTDYPDELWTNLPWDEKEKPRAKDLVRETVGRIFMPARSYLGDVVGLLESIGGVPGEYPSEEIGNRVMAYAQAAGEIVELAQLKGLDDASMRRLVGIIESRLRGVRSKSDAVAVLIKPIKTGGLEMDLDEADRIMSLAEQEMRLTRYVESLPAEGSSTEAAAFSAAAATETAYSPEEIRRRLAGSPEERESLAAAVSRLEQGTEGSADRIKERLHDIVYGQAGTEVDQWDAVAALILFVRRGLLLETLSGDLRFGQAVRSYLEERGGQGIKYLPLVRTEPTGPKAVNAFLQLVLRGVAGLSDEDAARYALRVTNVLKKSGHAEFSGLVAFDLDTGKFVWTDPLA
ncbi:MAG: hypothetical protein ABIJ46_02870 [bacterium]